MKTTGFRESFLHPAAEYPNMNFCPVSDLENKTCFPSEQWQVCIKSIVPVQIGIWKNVSLIFRTGLQFAVKKIAASFFVLPSTESTRNVENWSSD